jgi:hypothetical protein
MSSATRRLIFTPGGLESGWPRGVPVTPMWAVGELDRGSRRCPVFIMARAVRTSPGCWGLTRGLPEVLAQVRLVGEAAAQRKVTQGRIGRQHVLSGQFQATSHHKTVR